MIIFSLETQREGTGRLSVGRQSAPNNRPIIRRLIQKLILLSYLSYLFRLGLLSEDSYLLERLQSADKTKTHPKAQLQNAPTFTGNGNHPNVSTNDIHRCT